ncbi:MAG: hypothetical protein CMG50_00795 [Candidatus Marinimicrobia bacterium]|nr:hypothetical protein [Candidatus Neomarinimicrobiota bacterium]|tara:strand:- start:602 stop:1054 length:453 start_codon:yes stop_codon:yes gene_type:complete
MIFKVCIISILFFISCTVSPRYSGGGSHVKSKTKNLKIKTVNKGNVLRGVSSWYGPNFHGKLTANGEVYDMYGVTAAHKTLTLGTVVRVTNLDNEKSLILRINDRGPYVDGRILDCSFGAAKKLGFHEKGTANVEIKIIEEGDGVYMHHK